MKSLLKYFILGQDKITLLLDVFIMISVIGLIIIHMVLKKKEKGFKLWRMFCVLPCILCIIHFIFYRFSDWDLTETYYGSIYFSAVAIAIWQFFYKRKWRISCNFNSFIYICICANNIFHSIYCNNFSSYW